MKTERIHSLDALRAVMMMLGIVLHATEPYSLGDDVFWPKDPNARGLSLNFIFGIIHIFRMPIFFLIAGFFGALLFYERGPGLMIKNRLSRIVMPFIVFLLLLHPLITTCFSYMSDVFKDSVSPAVTTLTTFPQITYHLWFLYYLIFITAFSFLLASLFRRVPAFTARITRSFEWFMWRRFLFIPLFSIIIFLMLVWMWDTWATTSVLFTPDVKVMLFYSIFYFLGWVLFKSKHLLTGMMRGDWLFLSAAVLIFTLRFFFRSYVDDVLYGALNAIIIWFFVFGITGLFVRYASGNSPRMRYISDASYWVYLIHLPLVAIFSALMVDWHLPAFVKFLLVSLFTTVACFTSYHYLVRGSFIGKFLNGRKYPLRG
ncbi:MAG: acyltransferase family protein [Roseivirga sp.]|nr:acyltransferase family protein [Roseivirga sp.]